MGIERVFLDPQLVALAGHDVDRVMQDALDEKIAQLGHQDVRFGKMAERDRQGADMVVVAMRECNGLHFFFGNQLVKREAVAPLVLRMRAGVQEQAVSFDFGEPGAGADVGGWIEIDNAHEWPVNDGQG